ncbi:MAG: hypothetical protein LZF62_440086 [Nitrospira sp.]|nr:MAG: hypothetical protein LZF62_440086 [Nitrospira sp.]
MALAVVHVDSFKSQHRLPLVVTQDVQKGLQRGRRQEKTGDVPLRYVGEHVEPGTRLESLFNICYTCATF